MDEHLRRYAASHADMAVAAGYRTKYDSQLHKRISTRFERRAIARAFALAPGPYALALDVPSGSGRLSRELAPRAARIVEADFSQSMLELCRADANGDRRFVRLDALALPFADRAFDLVFSARFSHHVARDEDRERWLRELLRVARRTVIATVFDHWSLKNLLRLARAPFGKKRAKSTMRLARVRELAEAAGCELRGAIALSRLFSGHRYVVLVRREA